MQQVRQARRYGHSELDRATGQRARWPQLPAIVRTAAPSQDDQAGEASGRPTRHDGNTDVPRTDLYHAAAGSSWRRHRAAVRDGRTRRRLSRQHAPGDHCDRRTGAVGRIRPTTGRREDRGAGPSGPLGSPARLVIHYWAENISRTRVATDEPSKFCIVDRMRPMSCEETNWASSFHSNPGNGASAKAPFEARVWSVWVSTTNN